MITVIELLKVMGDQTVAIACPHVIYCGRADKFKDEVRIGKMTVTKITVPQNENDFTIVYAE